MEVKMEEYTEETFSVYAPPPDDIDDPHSVMTRDLAIAVERARAALPYKRRLFLEYHFKGYATKKACELAGLASAGNIPARIKDRESPEFNYLTQLRLVYALRMGPTIEQRKTLLWSIALRHKDKAPSAAIKAVDTLNRMDNIYETTKEGATIINNNVYQDVDWGKIAQLEQAAKDAKAIEYNPDV